MTWKPYTRDTVLPKGALIRFHSLIWETEIVARIDGVSPSAEFLRGGILVPADKARRDDFILITYLTSEDARTVYALPLCPKEAL